MKRFLTIILLFTATQVFSQNAPRLTYSIISELDILPASNQNYCNEECLFELKIPYIKADEVMAAIPDLPHNVSFVSMRRSEYADETFGTKIEIWLTFAEPGKYKLRYLRVTINGKLYNIPFTEVEIFENPSAMLPQLVIDFDNGTQLISQKKPLDKPKIAFEATNGQTVNFTLSLKYSVQLLSFEWTVPKDALFYKTKEFEITKGLIKTEKFSEEKVPVACFEWTFLKEGQIKMPEIHLTATAYNGSRIQLSMPEYFINVKAAPILQDTKTSENNYFSYAFEKTAKNEQAVKKFIISQENCKKIAELRSLERNDFPPFTKSSERKSYEKSLGINESEDEPTHFALYTSIALTIVFSLLLFFIIIAKKIPIIIIISTFSILFFVRSVVLSSRIHASYGIFTGGGVRAVPEFSVNVVESIESGRRVKIEQTAGNWLYIRVGTNGGWILKENLVEIK